MDSRFHGNDSFYDFLHSLYPLGKNSIKLNVCSIPTLAKPSLCERPGIVNSAQNHKLKG